MNPLDAQQLKLSIIQALEQTPDGQNLETIHETIHRPRRDLTVLPQVSALVTGGLIEKVAPARTDTANQAIGAKSRRPSGPPHSVRFRLTQDGRSMLAEARVRGECPKPVEAGSAVRAYVDYDNRESNDES
nr:hypothetical protein [Planctomycetota bacterium]